MVVAFMLYRCLDKRYLFRVVGGELGDCSLGAAWAILLGALARVFGEEDRGLDTAVWLGERKDKAELSRPGIGQSSMAHKTVEVLREISVLDDIVMTQEGIIIYPVGLDAEE